MSDVDYDDETDVTDGNAPKALREQNSKLAKQVKDLEGELSKLRSERQTSIIADVLREKQANPKLAKYVSRDLEGKDVTADAVAEWLKEEGELFGYSDPSVEEESPEAVQQERISRASSNAPSAELGITPEKLRQMTPQELIEAGYLNPL